VAGNEVFDIRGNTKFEDVTHGIKVSVLDSEDLFECVDVNDNVIRQIFPGIEGNWCSLEISGQPAVTEADKPQLPRGGASVAVRGNYFENKCRSMSNGIEITTNGLCLLSDNRCLFNAQHTALAAAVIKAGAAIISSNYIEQNPAAATSVAVKIWLPDERGPHTKGPYTVVGNIVDGLIHVNGVVLETPGLPLVGKDLNVTGI
jgi:hypothetical protein